MLVGGGLATFPESQHIARNSSSPLSVFHLSFLEEENVVFDLQRGGKCWAEREVTLSMLLWSIGIDPQRPIVFEEGQKTATIAMQMIARSSVNPEPKKLLHGAP
jgi:hypothetical protein